MTPALAGRAWPLACLAVAAPAAGLMAWAALLPAAPGLPMPSTVSTWATELDWQPALALHQPWRWWTAAWVHWSPLHLAMNLVGAALLAWLGQRAGLGMRAVAAWALAWPLAHLALLLQPGLAHYGGLSGVLHAGLGVVLVALWQPDPAKARLGGAAGLGRRRLVALGLSLGLLLKLWTEAPWGAPLRSLPSLDFAVAPLAHAMGALAGFFGGVCWLWRTHPTAPATLSSP